MHRPCCSRRSAFDLIAKPIRRRLTWTFLVGWMLTTVAATAHSGYEAPFTWVERSEEWVVRADASTTHTVSQQIRVDTEAGVESVSERRVAYSGSLETVEVLEAWTLTPDGRRLDVEPDKIRTLEAQDSGEPDFSDTRVKAVIYPAVTKGAIVGLRFRAIQHTPYFPGHATWAVYHQPGVRHMDVKVGVRQDPGVTLQLNARGMLGGQVALRPDDPPGSVRYAFTYQQDAALAPERARVDEQDFAPHLLATTFRDWADLAAVYQAGAQPKTELTPSLETLARELVKDATYERERVQRLYNWVSREIRYVAMAVGVGGYLPHSAESILANRYGDCKDHVVILEALLKAVGIASSPALVNLGKVMRLAEVPTFEAFNHVITYIPSLNLFLDATSRFAPMGTLPLEVMDKPVVLTATGQLARTPKTSPQTDYTHTQVKLKVGALGQVTGTSVATIRGADELDSRQIQFDNIGQPQEALAQRYLARFGESGIGELTVPDPLDLNQPWRVSSRFDLDPVVNVPGPSAMAVPIGLTPGRIRALATTRPSSERRFEAFCRSVNHQEFIEVQLPKSVRIQRIPPNVTFSRGPWRYSADYRRSGQVVHIRRELSVDRPGHICNARDDLDWAAVLPVLQKDLRGQVFFK
jgi:transglutaminase-like putative cysteine protease